jgi:hypothetical protein
MTNLAPIDVIAEDLPEHAAHLAGYEAAGLSRGDAFQLEALAAEIISRSARTVLEIGERLTKARSVAQYGTWNPFLERCGVQERTAQNYMNAWRKFGDNPQRVSGLPAAVIYQLAAPSADPDVVDAVLVDVDQGVRPTASEVRERLSPAPAVEKPPELPWDFVAWQRRAVALGADLTFDGREFILARRGHDRVYSAAWANMTSAIADLEAQTARPAEPPPAVVPAQQLPLGDEEEIAAAPPPAPAPVLTPQPAALPPALPGIGATVMAGASVEARKLLVCKRALLTAALQAIEDALARTPGATIVVDADRAEQAAQLFLQNPALGAAAAMLGFSARVESEAA